MISIVTSVAAFGGTYAWFAGDVPFDDEGANIIIAEMGTVDLGEIDYYNGVYTIENNSTIPIRLRVRVIVEWKNNGSYLLGEPTDFNLDTYFNNSENDWDRIDNVFIYGQDVEAGLPTPFEFTTPSAVTIDNVNWQPEVTIIAEAIQATELAYNAAWGGGDDD